MGKATEASQAKSRSVRIPEALAVELEKIAKVVPGASVNKLAAYGIERFIQKEGQILLERMADFEQEVSTKRHSRSS